MSNTKVEQIHIKHKTWFTRVTVTEGKKTNEFRLARGKFLQESFIITPGIFSKAHRGNRIFRGTGDREFFNTEREALDFCAG